MIVNFTIPKFPTKDGYVYKNFCLDIREDRQHLIEELHKMCIPINTPFMSLVGGKFGSRDANMFTFGLTCWDNSFDKVLVQLLSLNNNDPIRAHLSERVSQMRAHGRIKTTSTKSLILLNDEFDRFVGTEVDRSTCLFPSNFDFIVHERCDEYGDNREIIIRSKEGLLFSMSVELGDNLHDLSEMLFITPVVAKEVTMTIYEEEP